MNLKQIFIFFICLNILSINLGCASFTQENAQSLADAAKQINKALDTYKQNNGLSGWQIFKQIFFPKNSPVNTQPETSSWPYCPSDGI